MIGGKSMRIRLLGVTMSALMVAIMLLAAGQSEARELRRMRVALPTYGNQDWGEGVVLRRERHVLERRPTHDGAFLINGTLYQAEVGRCRHWVAGDRIKLRAGDWHGGPAVFR